MLIILPDWPGKEITGFRLFKVVHKQCSFTNLHRRLQEMGWWSKKVLIEKKRYEEPIIQPGRFIILPDCTFRQEQNLAVVGCACNGWYN